MQNQASERLTRLIPQIMNVWEQRVLEEVEAAHHQRKLSLRDSLCEYLMHLSGALSDTIERSNTRNRIDKETSTRLGKVHGRDRADSVDYTIDQLILEYHILRQVICELMEIEAPLTPMEREVIVGSIEQAVNDAATQFSFSMEGMMKIATQQAELKVSIKTRDEFLNVISHELKTPLSSLLLQAQMFLRVKSPTSDLQQINKINAFATQVVFQVGRLNHLINDMLDFGPVFTGSDGMKIKDVNVPDLLIRVIKKLNTVFQTFKVGPPSIIRSEEAVAMLDDQRIEQVIANLISNALKYGKGKPITIEVKTSEAFVEVIISDHGVGIQPADLDRIFNRFERAISPKEVTGLGLGLFIAREIIKAHRGKIWMESTFGIGSSVHFTLPKPQSKREGDYKA